MRELFLNGRHRRITVIMALQYALILPPVLRGNTDIVISARDPIKSSREKLYQQFFGYFDKLQSFEAVMMKLTVDYGVIVLINNQASSATLSDVIFHYRANPDIKCKFLCSKAFLRMHQRFYRPELERIKEMERMRKAEEARNSGTIIDVVRTSSDGATIIR